MNALKAETDLILCRCAVERQLCTLITTPMATVDVNEQHTPL
jgi:hypothetical protein